MRRFAFLILLVSCQKTEDKTKVGGLAANAAATARPKTPQVEAPLDIKNPPANATRTESGLIYKTLVAKPDGQLPNRNDTVMIKYTGWRQGTGETFFSNKTQDQAMPLNLATTARGFTEALQHVRKGEKAMLWLPPTIGLKEQPRPDQKSETLVYEVEVVDIQPAPAIPPDVASPPASALQTKKSAIKHVVVRPGTGKDLARGFDEVTFNYTGWDAEGRMFETTEMKKRPAKVAPFRQPPPFEEILTTMTAGQRVRFWVPAEKMQKDGKPQAGMPQGQLCYEVEVLTIDKGVAPPTVPADVAKPPGDAKKSPKGVFYKVLKPAQKRGAKPTPADSVRVHYTGWQTDGTMFDSSVIRNEPSEFSLQGVIAGWTEGIPLMSAGDKFRFWIPEELAYKGQPNKPQGMLVFDVELLEIKPAAKPDMPSHHP